MLVKNKGEGGETTHSQDAKNKGSMCFLLLLHTNLLGCPLPLMPYPCQPMDYMAPPPPNYKE